MEKIKKYGKIGIATHLTLSGLVFTGTYFIIKNSNKTNQIIRFFSLQNRIPKGSGALMISVVLYKLLMPVRFAITLVTVPIIANKFNLEPKEELEINRVE